jgi:threonine dehydratase
MAVTDRASHGEPRLPTHAGVVDAARRIRPYVAETPLARSPMLSAQFDADIWLKNETISPVASFKMRGAITELLRAQDAAEARGERLRGAVTSSTGNHGQGVAFAARLLQIPAVIFLPVASNPVKVAMIRALGAQIVEAGHDIDSTKVEARAYAASRGDVFVDDGEGLGVMEGAGTVGLEIASALAGLDAVFVPTGSGTLVSGCAVAIKAAQPACRIVAVGAEGSPAMAESFHARRSVERPVATIADGLACRVPAKLALDAMLALVDDAVLAAEEELLAAVHTMVVGAHALVEPSGAAGLVGAWHARASVRGRRAVVVLTGSNIAPPVLVRALAGPPLVPAS